MAPGHCLLFRAKPMNYESSKATMELQRDKYRSPASSRIARTHARYRPCFHVDESDVSNVFV